MMDISQNFSKFEDVYNMRYREFYDKMIKTNDPKKQMRYGSICVDYLKKLIKLSNSDLRKKNIQLKIVDISSKYLEDGNDISKNSEPFNKLITTKNDKNSSTTSPKNSDVSNDKNSIWNQIGGMDIIKRKMIDFIIEPIANPRYQEKYNLFPPSGIIFFGPPGTGKTLFGNALAEKLNFSVSQMTSTELVGSYVGESERNIRELFQKAQEESPSIIMLDEFEVLIPSRKGLSEQNDRRIANQFLGIIDGFKKLENVIVIGITNNIELIDRAAFRTGRFEVRIYFPPPDIAARREIFDIHLKGKGRPLAKKLKLEQFIRQTKNYTGADIKGICQLATRSAAREDKDISNEHLEFACRKIKPTLSDKDIISWQKQAVEYESGH